MTFVVCGDSHEPYAWPDGVVITDPPFGVGKTYDGVEETRTFASHVDAVLRIGAPLTLIRAPQESLVDKDVPQPRAVLIECRAFGPVMPNRRMRRWQPWLVYGRVSWLRYDVRDWFEIGSSYNNINADVMPQGHRGADHPGMTPPAAVRAIMERVRWNKAPGMVLDPFAGLGGIGAVVLTQGMGYRGMEQSADYADRAERRCVIASQSVMLNMGLV